MQHPETCRHHRLVSSRLCRVERCEHGTVHVTLGDLTLRMRADDLRELADALGVAAARVDPLGGARRFVC